MKKITRREFFTRSAANAAKLAATAVILKVNEARAASETLSPSTDFTSPEHCSSPVDREETHQVVVVGTGFGGAVSALRLGEAGIKTLVLERGQAWPITDEHNTFPSFKKPDHRCRWLGHTPALPLAPFGIFRKSTGLLERVNGPDVDIVVGAGVGGSSLTFGGVMSYPPRELFEKVFPKEIPYGEMETLYYPRVQKEMGFSEIPDDILNSHNYKVARMFVAHAQASGFQPKKLNAVYNWDTVRKELDGTLPKSTVIGQYMYGVSSGAKLSVDKNYIKRAKQTGNVEIRTHHQVQQVGQSEDGKYWLDVARINERGQIQERIRIHTEKLVLSAGSFWTSKLLVRAKHEKTMPNLNDDIGHYWGNNGERVFLRILMREHTLTQQGGPPCIGTMFQETPYGTMSFEIAPTAMPIELNAMCIATIGIPNGFGHFQYNHRNGKINLRYSPKINKQTMRCAKKNLRAWNRKSGGILVDFDALGPRPVSFHPLGGATLGKACDFFGRVQGQPGLYVIDSSLIPGSAACANPAWTIAALAERCMENIIANDFKG